MALTLGDMQEELGKRLGQRSDLDAVVERVAKRVQQTTLEGAQFKPWFLLTEVADASTTAGESRLPVPQDFIEEAEESALFIDVDGTEKALEKKDWEQLRGVFGDNAQPKYYALVGDYFRLAPTPEKIYTVRMIYVASQPLLDAAGDSNAWTRWAYDVFLSEVGLRVASELDFTQKINEFGQERQAAWARLRTQHESRMHTNMAYQMGG